MTDATPHGPAVKPVSRRLRFEILKRDGHTCRYCGAQAPDVPLTVDHVIPVALGGGNDPTNLVTACQPCNAGKGSTSPDAEVVAEVDAAAMLFAKAMERAAEIRSASLREETDATEQFRAVWEDWKYTGRDGQRHTIDMADGWRTSILRFLEAGLTMDDLSVFTRVAMESQARHDDKFRYFCGCLWRELADRQEIARRLIEDGQV